MTCTGLPPSIETFHKVGFGTVGRYEEHPFPVRSQRRVRVRRTLGKRSGITAIEVHSPHGSAGFARRDKNYVTALGVNNRLVPVFVVSCLRSLPSVLAIQMSVFPPSFDV